MGDVLPFSQCYPIDSETFERLNKTDWIMEPKIDGWRMQFDVTPDNIDVWTRGNKIATGKMPWVEKDLLELANGRHSFTLDGEAMWVNPETGEPHFRQTAGILGSGTDVAVWKQNELTMPVSFFVFDILTMDGYDIRDKTLRHRKEVMQRFLGETEVVKLVLGDEPTFEQHTANFQQFKEGSVIKDLRAPYMGKRNKCWRKWKEIETVDVKVIGFKEGQGKYTGLIGAIHFRAPDGTEGFCSGMDDATRVWISDHRNHMAGRLIEIKHFGKLLDGYRHPQFIRFREDL